MKFVHSKRLAIYLYRLGEHVTDLHLSLAHLHIKGIIDHHLNCLGLRKAVQDLRVHARLDLSRNLAVI